MSSAAALRVYRHMRCTAKCRFPRSPDWLIIMGLERSDSTNDEKPEVSRISWAILDLMKPQEKPQTPNDDLFTHAAGVGTDKRTEQPVSISIGGMVADKGSAPILSNTASMYVPLNVQHLAAEQATNSKSLDSTFAKADSITDKGGLKPSSFESEFAAKFDSRTLSNAGDISAIASKSIASSDKAQTDLQTSASDLTAGIKSAVQPEKFVEPAKQSIDELPIQQSVKPSDKGADSVVESKPLNNIAEQTDALKVTQTNNKPADLPHEPTLDVKLAVVPEKTAIDAHTFDLKDKSAVNLDASLKSQNDAPALEPKNKISTDNEIRRTEDSIKTLDDRSKITAADQINRVLPPIFSTVIIAAGGPSVPARPVGIEPVKPVVIAAPLVPSLRDLVPSPVPIVAPRPVESRPAFAQPAEMNGQRPAGQPPRIVAPIGEQGPRVPAGTSPVPSGERGRASVGEAASTNSQRAENIVSRQITAVSNASIALGGNDFKNAARDFTKDAATLAQIYTSAPQAVARLIISAQRESGKNVQSVLDAQSGKGIAAVIKSSDPLQQLNRSVLEPIKQAVQADLVNNKARLDGGLSGGLQTAAGRIQFDAAKQIASKYDLNVAALTARNQDQNIGQFIPGSSRIIGSIADRQFSGQTAFGFVKERAESGFGAAGQAGIKGDSAFTAFIPAQKMQPAFDVNSKTGMGLQAIQKSWNAAIGGTAHAPENSHLLSGDNDAVKKYAQHITQRMEEAVRRVTDLNTFAQKTNDANSQNKDFIANIGNSEASEMKGRNAGENGVELPPQSPEQDSTPSPFHSQAFIIALLLSIGGLTRGRFANADLVESDIASGFNDDEPTARPLSYRRRRVHMVEVNDTLQAIAEKYYGDARVAWLIADLNSPIEHNVDDGRVVELKSRQMLELPEVLEAKAFIRSLSREFDINKLTTIVTDTMINLEVLQNILGVMNLKEDTSLAPSKFKLPALTICAE